MKTVLSEWMVSIVRRWRFGLLCVLLWSVSACAVIDRYRAPEDPCTTADSLFVDSFDGGNLCEWRQFDAAGVSAEIESGVHRLTVGNSGQVTWSTPERMFDDVEIVATARQVSGPNNNAYGLICRYVDDENFYLFLISGDGYYAVARYASGQSQVVYLTGDAPDFYQPSSAIVTGVAENRLRVICAGDRLMFFVNGEQVADVQDTTHPAGDIGIAAATFEAEALTIEFDDIAVTAP